MSSPASLRLSSISALRQRLFLAKTNSDAAQFLLAQTEDGQASLILDEESLNLFPKEHLTVSGCWRAISIWEGSEAINEAGYIQLLSGALAERGIPLIYLSTFNTDLLLVVEDQFEDAMATLMARVRSLTTALETKQHMKPRTTEVPSLEVSIRSNVLRIANLDPDQLEAYSRTLIQAVLFPPRTEQADGGSTEHTRFLSLTYAQDERTLIADEETVALFDEKYFLGSNSYQWQAIEVHEGEIAGLEKTNWLSSVLANQNISLFYVTTFDVDHLLVKRSRVSDALDCLQRQLNLPPTDGNHIPTHTLAMPALEHLDFGETAITGHRDSSTPFNHAERHR